ncbi:MAG: YceD family protein, partial [Rhodovulum sp.]
LVPDGAARDAIAARLGLIALKKLRFEGEFAPEGRCDWRLTGRLGATVVQPCVVTLAPVTTRIDIDVLRSYREEMPPPPAGHEVEMPEDDTEEPLPEVLNLMDVIEEALALALPLYPRAEGAEIAEAIYGPPGAAPMCDEDTRPFAVLARLKGKQDLE